MRMTVEFENDDEREKFDNWLKEQNAIAIRMQKEGNSFPAEFAHEFWEDGYPYTGAIGGEIEYILIPTSVGVITKVKHSLTEDELDLTDYENW